MKQKRQLTRTIQVWGILLIIGIAGSITTIDIIGSYRDFKLNSELIRKDYIAGQKKIIQQEVIDVVELIAYEKSQSEVVTKKKIQERTYEAYSIAQNIYQHYKIDKSTTEIQTMIMEALRPIRFADGSGYFFATSLDGIERLSADKPDMEGMNLMEVQDTRGKYVIRDMIAIAQQAGEGFYEYHWTKPDTAGNDFKKLSFVKLFEPYNLFIGTGLYVGDVEKQIQADLLETIGRIRFGEDKDGYIFVVSYDGTTLMNDTQRNLIGKNIWNLTDPNGVKVIQEERKAIENPQGDFIYYTWSKPSSKNPSPKTSFMKGVKDWEWMVGAGVYLDDVETEIALKQAELSKQIQKKIFMFSICSLIIIAFFLFIFNRLSRILKNDSCVLISFFKQAAFSDESIDRDLVHFEELDQLAENANKMLQEKIEAEKQLKMLKVFSESSNQGMGWATLDGNIEYVNPALTALFGENDQNTPIGKNVIVTYYPEKEQQRLEEEILPRVLEDGSWTGELMLQKRNGEEIPTYNNLFLILDKASEPVFFANIVTDISESKKAEKEKENLTEKLHIAQKMESIGLMAGGVAHDLNNILSGIICYPELMLHDLPPDSDLRTPLEAIQQSGQKAATVVADLLTVARGVASIRENHDLNTLVRKYLDSPEYQNLRTLHPNTTCRHQLNSTKSIISCSPVHVQKCLMNLVTNGCEAITDTGTVTVSTSNQHVDAKAAGKNDMEAGKYVVLTVEDTGTGIAAKDLEHIFEPFYTKKNMGKSGSGLGLAVVWNTMEDHKGKVFVESGEKGTCFYLYFPESDRDKVQQAEENATEEKLTGKNEHILIVDDESDLRNIAQQMLTNLGYRVDAVKSGEAAIEFLQQKPVDLLLIDMLMEPGMSGRQTYEAITKLYPNQKAVIASGFSETEDVRATLQLGAGEFIKKPYSTKQLARAIKKVLTT